MNPYLLANPKLTILAISSSRSQYLSSFSLPFLFRQNIKHSAMIPRDWIHFCQIIILWRHFISRSSKPLLVLIYRKPTFGGFSLSFLEMHQSCLSRFCHFTDIQPRYTLRADKMICRMNVALNPEERKASC